jgi:hypothetical protein
MRTSRQTWIMKNFLPDREEVIGVQNDTVNEDKGCEYPLAALLYTHILMPASVNKNFSTKLGGYHDRCFNAMSDKCLDS